MIRGLSASHSRYIDHAPPLVMGDIQLVRLGAYQGFFWLLNNATRDNHMGFKRERCRDNVDEFLRGRGNIPSVENPRCGIAGEAGRMGKVSFSWDPRGVCIPWPFRMVRGKSRDVGFS
jgi:hypothetical protein